MNWKLFNKINSSLPSLCKGEEEALTDLEIATANVAMQELFEARQKLERILNLARDRF